MTDAAPARVPAPALAVCAAEDAAALSSALVRLELKPSVVADPYGAFAELLERPMVYRVLVVSLAAVYRDELALVRTVRQRLPHVTVVVAHPDGRAALLAEAMRQGASGLLDGGAIHSFAEGEAAPRAAAAGPARAEVSAVSAVERDDGPLLTPDELRALLHGDVGGG